jgi:hydrogenase maturation factor
MCLTAPVRVTAIAPDGTATIVSGAVERTASTLAVPEVRVGDWALLSAGLLVRILPPDVASELAAAVRTAAGDDS